MDSSVIYISKITYLDNRMSTFVTRAACNRAWPRLALLFTRQRRQSILPYELTVRVQHEMWDTEVEVERRKTEHGGAWWLTEVHINPNPRAGGGENLLQPACRRYQIEWNLVDADRPAVVRVRKQFRLSMFALVQVADTRSILYTHYYNYLAR